MALAEPVRQVRAWLLADIGDVPLSGEWLSECVAHLRAMPAVMADESQLPLHVRAQLMASDLVQSMDRGTLGGAHAFVQVTSVMDVGVSAQALHDAWLDGAPAWPRGMLRLELSDGFRTAVAYEHEHIPALSIHTCLGTKLLLHTPVCEHDTLLLTPRSVQVLGGTVPELDSVSELAKRICMPLGKDPSVLTKAGRTAPRRQKSGAPSSATPPRGATARPTQTHGVPPTAPPAAPPTAPPTGPSTAPPAAPASPPTLLDDDWDSEAELVLRQVERASPCSLLQKLNDMPASSPSNAPPPPTLTPTPTSTASHDTLILPKRDLPTSRAPAPPVPIDLVSSSSSSDDDHNAHHDAPTYIAISDDSDA